jgi:hypothetical protein
MTRYRERREAGEFEPPAEPTGLDQMTKAELLQLASERGLDVHERMTKDELREVIDEG